MKSTTATRYSITCAIVVSLACRAGADTDQNTAHSAVDEPTRGERLMSQAEQDRRVDYIEFLSTDIAETKRFYNGVFGWEFTDYGPDYTSFSDGRLAGGFSAATEVRAGGPLVVLYSTNLEQIEAVISENGGKIVREIFEFPGGRRFHFTDPSGNELAVWSDR
jgi:predicted enzyme related to lactoylglutathione lyase